MGQQRQLWALLAIGLLGLAGCSDEPRAEADEPQYVVLRDDDSDPDQMGGRAGAYAMTARGHEEPRRAVVDVPTGFTNFGFFAMWPQPAADGDEPFQAIQYWTVYGVHPDPCHRKGAAPEVGDSVEALATALQAQRRTRVSSPRPVSLGGQEGLYLELTVPSTLRVTSCDLGYYVFWEGAPNDAHHTTQSAGAVERLWILEVDGIRVVLTAITDPGATDAQAEALSDIVRSVRFVEAE